jgi:hypothetical protein
VRPTSLCHQTGSFHVNLPICRALAGGRPLTRCDDFDFVFFCRGAPPFRVWFSKGWVFLRALLSRPSTPCGIQTAHLTSLLPEATAGLAQTPFPHTKFPRIPIPLINLRPIRPPFESLLYKKYLDKLSRLALTCTVNIAFQPAPSSRSGTRPLPAPRIPPRPRTLCELCVSVFSWSSFFSRSSLALSLERSPAASLSAEPLEALSIPHRSSRTFLPLSSKKSQNLTPLFSHPSALFKKEGFANSFRINSFRTLSQNTGGGTLPDLFSFLPLLTIHNSLLTNSLRICTSKKYASNPCRIRSFKTHDLKPFRMCSCEKTPYAPLIPPNHFLFFPHRVNMQRTATPTTPFFSCPYFTVLWIPGGRGTPLRPRKPGSVRNDQ